MTAQELISTLKSATIAEIAEIRVLLLIPSPDYYRTKDTPKNLGEILERPESKDVTGLR